MATRKTKTQEKKYVVLYEDAEVWVVGTKKDIITDFNKDPELYVKEAKNIKIYELGELLPFKFITPQIVL
jgi:cytidine deaminase